VRNLVTQRIVTLHDIRHVTCHDVSQS